MYLLLLLIFIIDYLSPLIDGHWNSQVYARPEMCMSVYFLILFLMGVLSGEKIRKNNRRGILSFCVFAAAVLASQHAAAVAATVIPFPPTK